MHYRPPAVQPTGPGGLPLAEFGDRLLAYLLDSLIITAIVLVPMAAGMVLLFMALFSLDSTTPDTPDPVFIFGSFLAFFVLIFVVQFAGTYLYQVTYQMRNGVTVGKRVMKLRIVDAQTGAPMDVSAARKRWIIHLLLAFVPIGSYLDGLWQLWDERKQTLHDKVARTVVVKVPA
jgi:uncharacterized RDD family membrane protein YckC